MANTTTYINKIVVPNGSDTITANLVDTVSGYIKLSDVPKEVMIVNLTTNNGTYTADKQFDDILENLQEGKLVYVITDDTFGIDGNSTQKIFIATDFRSDSVAFMLLYDSSTDNVSDSIIGYELSLTDYNVWGLVSFEIKSLPTNITSSDVGKTVSIVANGSSQRWDLTDLPKSTIRRWSGS